jgi:radical SAM superfamily enzyme YgiQ (UPF0313 family)
MRDSIARRESERSFERFIAERQHDFIFIESATPSWETDRAILLRLRALNPKAQLVVTGPVTTTLSDQILSELPVTACIQGEYEKGAVRVLNGERGIIPHDLLTVAEMNAAPWPMYDEACATNYYDRNPRSAIRPHAQVWASRGCPYKCIFCVWPAAMTGNDPTGEGKRTVRHYRDTWLEPYLRHIIAKYGYRSVYFDDDTFNLGNAHTLEMCEMMKRINLPWSAMCRADTIKMETWQAMRDAGCYGVKLGFESGNQQVVDQIVNKHLDLTYASDVVRHLKKIGMTVHGTFTIGLPGETPEQMRQTFAFSKSLPFDSIQVSGTAEIEGTPLHRLRAEGKLDAYAGAAMDENYNRHTDGGKKWQSLADELQRS